MSPHDPQTNDHAVCRVRRIEHDSSFQADPKNFVSEPPWAGNVGGLRVLTRGNKEVASFCMVGLVTACSLKTNGGRSKQLSLQPLERHAPRMATVLARMLSYSRPTFITKAYGLSFSTKINSMSFVSRSMSTTRMTYFSWFAQQEG